MGDSSNGCRGFETPSLGNDLWPMGFDVDLAALDGPGCRNKGPGANNNTGALGNNTLNNLQSTNNVGYNDMHHFTGLSSILQKFDDLHAGDISQMTDLTNSLHKGDSETAQSLLAKLACQDLGPDLSTGPDNSHKGLDSALFGHTQGPMSHGNLNNTNGTILQPKPTLQPSDVYGKVTCYEGKLVLQLRHFNLNTNYTLNVSECWICGEAIAVGSQLCTHKHVLGGLFQVNDEYVQMDIDHYILPEQEINTPDTPGSLKYPVSLHSDSSNIHQQINSSRDLNLSDNLSGNTDMHYHPETSIVTSLSSSSSLMGTTSDHNSCLSSTFGSLSLPGMQLPVDHSNMHHGISGLNVPSVSASLSQTLHSGNESVFSSNSSNHNQTNNILNSNEGNLKKDSLQMNHTTGENTYNLCHFTDNIQTSVASLSSQESMCELTVRNKISDTYQLPFSNAGDYTCHIDNGSEKAAEKHVHNTHISIETDSKAKSISSNTQMKTTEIGAKKRKSRTPKKPDPGKIKYEDNSISIAPLKQYKSYISRTDASIEDWIRHNLPEGDLEVTETPAGNTVSGDNYPKVSKVEDLYSQGIISESQMTPSKLIEKDRPKEPDQTTRRAAHIISGGLDLSCRLCFKEYKKDVKNYKSHMKEHGISENECFSCSICSKIFAKYKHYMQHLKSHLSTRRFTCQICGASYGRDDKLRRHMLSHSKEKTHKCTHCTKTFHRKEYLDNHLEIHEGKKYKCDICSVLCSSMFNLETHKLKHSKDKSFRCELCEKSFIRRDFLDSHMELIHKNKKLQCPVCQKLFSRKDVLKRHEAVHKNLSFDCDICNKKFTRRDRLVSHMKIHEKESEYKCSLCPSVFTRKEILEKHVNCHNLKEQCDICYKFFPTKRKLQLHQESHKPESSLSESPGKEEDTFKCEVCDKKMSTRNTLSKHLRQIHGKVLDNPKKPVTVQKEKLFVCNDCSKGFTRSCNLKAHILKAHKKKGDKDDENDLDDLPSVLQKIESSYIASTASSSPPENVITNSSYNPVCSSPTGNIDTLNSSVEGSTDLESGVGLPQFQSTLSAASSAASHLTAPLNFASSQFQSNTSPDSPINLSTDAITAAAAACLLAYPSYPY
ncbi:unnamed protein product, partial [Meganyctiphanes norvegica]